jgi:L-threonylcarbamoyladenylate synthase
MKRPTILDGSQDAAIARAVDALVAGELIGMPTETVYGLAADAGNDAAVARIFSTKGRPTGHPLIVHLAPPLAPGWVPDAARRFAADLPDFAERLIAAFWPGPLTLILPRAAGIGSAAAGGQDSIGLRCPSHPVAQALLRACAARDVHGLAAPSANRFGKVSPTTAEHVQDEFSTLDLLVLDGGACSIGIESAIVDCSRGFAVLLRPGAMLGAEELLDDAGSQPLTDARGQQPSAPLLGPAPRASGTLAAHYAPEAKLRLMSARALQTALDLLGADAAHLAVYARAAVHTSSERVILRRMPDDAAATAQQLFAVLRGFDAAGARLIWVETPPDDAAWEGVTDRLTRAAAV